MPTFYWEDTTNTIAQGASGFSATDYEAPIGASAINLVRTHNGVPVLLDASQSVGFCMQDPNNRDEGYLAGVNSLARGNTGADGYVGTTNTNTPLTVSCMKLGQPGVVVEPYTGSASFLIFDAAGNALIESLPFEWTILPSNYTAGMPPTAYLVFWPDPISINNALAQLANAQPRLPLPAANGYYVTINLDGSVVPVPLPTTTATWIVTGNQTVGGTFGVTGATSLTALTVSAASTFEGLASFGAGVSITGAGAFTGEVTAQSFSGNGGPLTNLNPANLSGAVGVGLGGTGATTAAGALGNLGAAPLNGPTFTGVGTIPTGWQISDYAALAGATFTGAVTLPAGSTVAGYATLSSPTFTGTVTIPAGASIAGYARLATVQTWTGAQTFGTIYASSINGTIGNVTGLAPFHPASTAGKSTSWSRAIPASNSSFLVNDAAGQVSVTVNGTVNAGTVVGTVTFAVPYGAYPAQLGGVTLNPLNATSIGVAFATLSGDGTSLTITFGGASNTAFPAGTYAWAYNVAPV